MDNQQWTNHDKVLTILSTSLNGLLLAYARYLARTYMLTLKSVFRFMIYGMFSRHTLSAGMFISEGNRRLYIMVWSRGVIAAYSLSAQQAFLFLEKWKGIQLALSFI